MFTDPGEKVFRGHIVQETCLEGQPGCGRSDISLNLFSCSIPVSFMKHRLFMATLTE